jgi:hypothetical protein
MTPPSDSHLLGDVIHDARTSGTTVVGAAFGRSDHGGRIDTLQTMRNAREVPVNAGSLDDPCMRLEQHAAAGVPWHAQRRS